MKYNFHGPEELKQANYTLQSLPKGLRFLRGSACLGVSKGHGPYGYSQSRCPLALYRLHLLSLVQEGGAE